MRIPQFASFSHRGQEDQVAENQGAEAQMVA
jgi:hypothetical protein